MDRENYLEGTTILDYCLGLLKGGEAKQLEAAMECYPAVAEEVRLVKQALESYLSGSGIEPKADMPETLLCIFRNLNLERRMEMDRLPLVNKFSDAGKWLSFVRPFLLAPETGGYEHMLTERGPLRQRLLVTDIDFVLENPPGKAKSMLVLEGACVAGDGMRPFGVGYVCEIKDGPLKFSVTSQRLVSVVQTL